MKPLLGSPPFDLDVPVSIPGHVKAPQGSPGQLRDGAAIYRAVASAIADLAWVAARQVGDTTSSWHSYARLRFDGRLLINQHAALRIAESLSDAAVALDQHADALEHAQREVGKANAAIEEASGRAGSAELRALHASQTLTIAQLTGDPAPVAQEELTRAHDDARRAADDAGDAHKQGTTVANEYEAAAQAATARYNAIADAFPTTVGPMAGPAGGGALRGSDAAADWAYAHVNDDESFGEEDCTWFVSQALWAGGLPKSGDWTGKSWSWGKVASNWHYPGPTKAAVNAQAFREYIVDEAKLATIKPITWSDNTAAGAAVGDVIAYDWDEPGPDGKIDHLAIVTQIGPSGYPLVTQHTPARTNRGWSWDPSANNWIEFSQTHDGERPKAYLIHIAY